MDEDKIVLTFYAQRIQGNGFHSVERYEITEKGSWYITADKTIDGTDVFPDDRRRNAGEAWDEPFRRSYYLSVLKNNFDVFSTKEIFSGKMIHESDLTYEQLEELINKSIKV